MISTKFVGLQRYKKIINYNGDKMIQIDDDSWVLRIGSKLIRISIAMKNQCKWISIVYPVLCATSANVNFCQRRWGVYWPLLHDNNIKTSRFQGRTFTIYRKTCFLFSYLLFSFLFICFFFYQLYYSYRSSLTMVSNCCAYSVSVNKKKNEIKANW